MESHDKKQRYSVNLPQAQGVQIGDHGAQTNIFQMFAQAPASLSSHIRTREFETLVSERTKTFVGRGFIFSAISRALADETFPSGYIVIRGEPGIGKTSLVAQLVKTYEYPHHFNIAAQNIRSTRDFLSNVCAQLIVRYKLDYSILPPQAAQDSGFLSKLLTEASGKRGNDPIVVLIDALDEVEDLSLALDANRLYLPPSLPANVYFVITTREREDYQLVTDRRKDIYIRKDDPENQADVRAYIHGYLTVHSAVMSSRISEWGLDRDQFEDILTSKSEGNFMYLVHVLSDIMEGILTKTNIDNLDDLPAGLRQYYQRHWRTMKGKDGVLFEQIYQPVVCMLAVVREPVSEAQIQEWTGLSAQRVRGVIEQWRSFLTLTKTDSGERLYRIYHASFQDFLKDEVGLTPYHNKIAQIALDKIPGIYKNT
jgi:Cdc6-like AAA superfamily ATPase